MRQTILLPIKDRAQFLEMYFEKGGLAGLFVKGDVALQLGDDVDLELSFLEEQLSFRIRGTVRWRRAVAGRRSLPPGLGIEFSPEESRAQKLLLDYAMGRAVPLVHREDRRFGAAVKVKMNEHGAKVVHETDDISTHGAFIITDERFDIGEEFDLTLHPPRSIFPLPLRARVKWRRDDGRIGVGVEFMFDSNKQEARVARFVEKLRTQAIKELKVRVPKLAGRAPPQA